MNKLKAAQPEKMELTSMDVAEQKRDELKRCLQHAFPEVFSEGMIDFDQLKRVLGEWVDPGKERFGLNWPGKAECMKVVQQPSRATLKPLREESVEFDETENLFIEGDNLEVLKLLQKSYFGKIKMIYIDPPYNTGHEFIYPDKYEENIETYLSYTDQLDSDGRPFSTNTDTAGRFHSRWLNMMFPRLYLARNLLSDSGAIFISIGQDEVANLLHLCFDVFGEENFVTICSRVMKTGGQKGVHFSPSVDYILVFAKNINELSQFRQQISQNVIDKVYTKVEAGGPRKGQRYRAMGLYQAMLDKRANQRFYIECPDGSLVIPPGDSFPDQAKEGAQVTPSDGDGVWRWTYNRYSEEKKNNNIEFVRSDRSSLVHPDGSAAKWNVYYKIWLNDRMEDGQLPGNILEKFESRHSSAELKLLEIPFDFAKPSALIKFLMSVSGVGDGDVVLDFFAGSASTAHAAIELSAETGEKRPFICVQLPEKTTEDSEERRQGYKTISAIGIERVRRVLKRTREANETIPLDYGMRVYRLDRSNFRVWDGQAMNADALSEQIELHIDHVSEASSQEDLLHELLLKSGFPLSTKIQTVELAGKRVFSIEDGSMLICLEKEITPELIDALADANPLQVICLDEGFKGNDQLKANAVQTFRARAQAEESEIVFKTV
ncbi:site-specific DNA-methyltransferase [Brucella pseudintermedia]|uniref:site-specific DNA-methyltransferase n=1 Tax=Brucella pseudintermedia TaxID=370111 RepID=UPI0032088DD7